MMDTLRKKAVRSGVKIIDRLAVTDILVKDGQAVGALGFNYRKSEIVFIRGKALVNAAGGCAYGSVFMGIKNLTGDLQAAAYRAGAVMQNMEFSNSNTTARDYDIHGLNLIVSAGGRFLNNRDEEFMWAYHPELGSRAPQAYLANAFCREVAQGRGPVMLDLSAAKPDERQLLRKILPETFKVFDRAGIDIFSRCLPWIPAFQGTIAVGGGLAINTRGETSLPGLYAAGDATPLPPNGSTNVGGLCLSVAALTGYRAGEAAGASAAKVKTSPVQDMEKDIAAAIAELMAPLGRIDGLSPDEVVWAVQEAIIPVGKNYIKSKEKLEEGLARIETVKAELPKLMARGLHELMNVVGARSMVTLAELFLKASIFREESRGLHFREEFPKTNNRDWLKWVKIQKEESGPKLWTEDIPTPYVRPSQEFSLPPGVKRV
jgi:succinate dehydrogenase/fumarate reductase flavoprotein subunit